MSGQSAAEIEALIERHRWLRELARSLVIDADTADELVQEAWIAALERGPTRDAGFRGWLAQVVRNLARQHWRANARRTRHERAASVRDRAPSSSSEHFETYEFLVNAVGALDEPYKTAVILRYFEELTPREIAERLGVPVDTVQTRLHRALERLRARLDRRTGDRATWLAFVAPLAELAKSSNGALAWSWIVKTQTKIALAMVALVLLSLVAVFAGRTPGESFPQHVRESSATSPRADATRVVANSNALGERRAFATIPELVDDTAAPAVAVRGIVVDCDDRALTGVKVALRADGSSPSSAPATSDADGRFTLTSASSTGVIDSADERFTGVLRPRVDAASRELDQVLVVAPRRSLRGIVENSRDEPVAGASVRVELAWGFREHFARSLLASESRAWTAKCDSNGVFAIVDLPDIGDMQVVAKAFGYSEGGFSRLAQLPANAPTIIHLPNALDQGPCVSGSVVDERGRAIVGAVVEMSDVAKPLAPYMTPNHVSSDVNGEFHVKFVQGDASSRVVLRAFAKGRLPVEIVREGAESACLASWSTPIVVRLDRETKSIAGRVVESDGKPVSGCALWIEDPTPFGVFEANDKPQSRIGSCDLEALLAGSEEFSFVRDAEHATFSTDANGQFVVRGLLDRTYTIVALDPEHMRFGVTAPVAAGAENVELAMASIESGARISGRVIDPQGKPVADVEITLEVSQGDAVGTRPHDRASPVWGKSKDCDANGRFEFDGVHANACMIWARPRGAGWIGNYAVIEGTDLGDVVIHVAKSRLVRVDARGSNADPLWQICAVGGEPRAMLPILEGEHNGWPWSQTIQMAGEISPVFAVPETATAIQLLRNGRVSSTLPLHFGDAAITIVKP